MTKSFTINAPEYQEEQKKFYAYNVANDESVINAASIKKKSSLVKGANKWTAI